MTDDQNQKKQQNVNTDIPERPLDPTQNAGDMLGDTAGLTGITQGAPRQSGAEPTDVIQDETEIRGGVIQNPTQNQPTGYPKSAVSDKEYKKEVQQGLSSEAAKTSEDVATEPSDETRNIENTPFQNPSQEQDGYSDALQEMGNEQSGAKARTVLLQEAPFTHPENLGSQDGAGGSESAPETDDDTLAMAQRAGFQTDEDTEHPKPVDAGRDIDKAEEKIS